MSKQNGHVRHAPDEEADGVVHLTYEQSKALAEMAEQPGDATGEAYARWMRAEAERARAKRQRSPA